MKLIQVLGPGCARCHEQRENVERAVQELGIEATVEKIDDISAIAGFGVMMTPAIAVDGEVKSQGKVLTTQDVKQILS